MISIVLCKIHEFHRIFYVHYEVKWEMSWRRICRFALNNWKRYIIIIRKYNKTREMVYSGHYLKLCRFEGDWTFLNGQHRSIELQGQMRVCFSTKITDLGQMTASTVWKWHWPNQLIWIFDSGFDWNCLISNSEYLSASFIKCGNFTGCEHRLNTDCRQINGIKSF